MMIRCMYRVARPSIARPKKYKQIEQPSSTHHSVSPGYSDLKCKHVHNKVACLALKLGIFLTELTLPGEVTHMTGSCPLSLFG